MRSISHTLGILFLIFYMSGCSIEQLVNPITPRGIHVNQVYWNPAIISRDGCPDLTGIYLIPAAIAGSGGLPGIAPGISSSGKLIDIEVSFELSQDGLIIREISPPSDKVHIYRFNDYFGCNEGRFIRRGRPFVVSGAEVARCDSIAYEENHWSIDSKNNLVAVTVYRSRCWRDRLSATGKEDRGPYTSIHRRIH